ncbi:aldehyde dehydrogenase family protein [Sphingobium fuliginis]|uniref:Aldehyde dehydrogenase family protein n=1 Tax=Sphingobium fuliginis ATCC 27551 TaxID=1208342 RepID=A0A5B8CN92_SPHSA|nr:aldehyde dehydrogenase family protein [Sphingobium fuliginis]QDC40135.1 aldehyde dehydrogenase family protein [Sphingobium fuliginis ATCC 27551]
MLIDGELVASASGRWMTSVSPVDEEPLGQVPEGTAADVDRAAAAAMRAFASWRKTSMEERGATLRDLARAIEARYDEILALEAADTGNGVESLRFDLDFAIWTLNHYAGLGYQLTGETVPATAEGLHLTLREPYGVVGRIVPFNHPFLFSVARTAAALMAGNAVVLKTPETSPLGPMIYAEICQQLLPPGLMNIISGRGMPVGDAIARDKRIRRVAFIGSPDTGRLVQKAAAESCVKHVTLELGGKNPMIVYPDADYDAAALAAVRGMNFLWAGQSCGSTSRLLVHESLYDRMVDDVGRAVAAIKVGRPEDPETGIGPMNSRAQVDKALRYMDLARSEGARLVTGGGRVEGPGFEKGFWAQPTVFADVTGDMRIAREEVFGPILSIMKWRDEDEAFALANDVEYGLTGSIWTRDVTRALTAARAVEAGYIWINTVGSHFRAFPYGGYKNSGVGREESIEELFSYTQCKAVTFMP